jgi:pimeloyl-ACP methyl ester carboxylesterase
MKLYLLAGPPFGPRFWDGVSTRMDSQGVECEALDPFSQAGRFEDLVRLVGASVGGQGCGLVAHGSALPIALEVAGRQELDLLVLTNGPISSPDPFLAGLARMPGAMRRVLLRPPWSTRFFRSSAGMRRMVVNPYVMDYDTIVTVCEPLQSQTRTRANYSAYISLFRDLPSPVKSKAGLNLIVWGDADALYPTTEAEAALNNLDNSLRVDIPGGKHLHPIERPWALADKILEALKTKL